MHKEAFEFVDRWQRVISRPRSVLEVGSRNVNGSVRGLFPCSQYIGIDTRTGPGVDVVADGASWDGWGRKFDLVLCLEVLEHAADQEGLCRNLLRLAARSGVILVTAAGPQRVPHGADGEAVQPGESYRNVSWSDLRAWFGGAELCAVEDMGEDIRAVILAR